MQKIKFAIVLALGVVGCAGEEEPEGEIELNGYALSAELAPPQAASVEPLRDMAELKKVVSTDPGPALATWDREELSDALRPLVMNRDGALYLGTKPNYAAADAVIRSNGAERMVDVSVEDGRPLDAALILGGDQRAQPWSNTASPYRNVVRLDLWSGNTWRGWCTGSYIGPWTVITSAHCLSQANGVYVNRIIFEPARHNTSFPYGSFDCRNDDANGDNNFLWAIPGGYAGGSADSPFDYAVIDTWPCHGAPAWFGGYLINPPDGAFTTYGYPQDACPGAGAATGTKMCGMTGSGYANGHRIESDNIDAEGGQSGSAWWVQWDIQRPAGILSGWRSYFDLFRCGFNLCYRNTARRIDDSVSSFIVSWSYDY
jgi:hypothetical protein